MGTLKLYKSMGTAYEFNKLGMTSNMTSPLASGAVAMQQSYQVCQIIGQAVGHPNRPAYLLSKRNHSIARHPLQISEKDVQFVRTLGQGASALVQKAFWPAKSEFVAVKKISVLEREKRHQLMNDIKALCKMPNVPGLIRFYGAYHSADRGQIAVALEYMDGGSLADVLGKVKVIPEDVLAAITHRILQGLAYMHSHHMVHRDIKPANILMSTGGEPKVSDFGISAFIDSTMAQCQTFLGTVTYMSPERINGAPYSFPADIWALGLTLLECATGRYPYDASGGAIELMLQLMQEACPVPKDGTVSPAFRDFVETCMAKDPMARPTAEDLLRHPFVAGGQGVDLKGFMQCMYDPVARLEDVVTILTSRYYNHLAYNWREEGTIAAYYASDAVRGMGRKFCTLSSNNKELSNQ
jgi:serine/threonine protein kinase